MIQKAKNYKQHYKQHYKQKPNISVQLYPNKLLKKEVHRMGMMKKLWASMQEGNEDGLGFGLGSVGFSESDHASRYKTARPIQKDTATATTESHWEKLENIQNAKLNKDEWRLWDE